MPSKVYNNVVDHRALDGEKVVEDVTSVTLPDIEHDTSTISASGMVADVDMPNMLHIKAMSYSIAHNNGVNCNVLAEPRKHEHEWRLVREKYNVALAEMEYESVKYRMVGLPTKTSEGTSERGNPMGSTEDYSCLRYEKEIDGVIVTLVDAMAGILKWNGVEYSDTLNQLLD